MITHPYCLHIFTSRIQPSARVPHRARASPCLRQPPAPIWYTSDVTATLAPQCRSWADMRSNVVPVNGRLGRGCHSGSKLRCLQHIRLWDRVKVRYAEYFVDRPTLGWVDRGHGENVRAKMSQPKKNGLLPKKNGLPQNRVVQESKKLLISALIPQFSPRDI